MRFYEIVITDPDGKAKPITYTSFADGANDPGALNLSLDIYTIPQSQPANVASIELWGIPLTAIAQASDLNGRTIKVTVGFQKGLPLATSKYNGVIGQGTILQAFGNWQGVEQTLNIFFVAGTRKGSSGEYNPLGTTSIPINASFSIDPGVPLQVGIEALLKGALQGYTYKININPHLIVSSPQSGVYPTLQSFANWLQQYTRQLIGGTYPGVNMRVDPGNVISVYDNTEPQAANSALDAKTAPITKTVEIQFQDLIGQPIWMGVNQMQFKCPMRADINLGDKVKMPSGFWGIQPQQAIEPWAYRFKSEQQGTFQISEVHHMGYFRQPDGNSWVTVFTAVKTS
jgi:hypothetical protein